jgi:DNA-binding FadR family transcriptional regulator
MMHEPLGIQRGQLHRTVQDRIKRFIIEHGMQAGDPLPAEAEMARLLNVSRSSLREALSSLQTLGVVEVRHGSGTFVGHFSLDPLVDALTFRILIDQPRTLQTVRELLDIRMILESNLIARVARHHSPAQTEQLQALIAKMAEQTTNNGSYAATDRAFHEALYLPLGNQMVVNLLGAFWDVISLVRDRLGFEKVPPLVTTADHRKILAAIEASDADAAVAAMIEHFHGIQARLPGGAQQTKPSTSL